MKLVVLSFYTALGTMLLSGCGRASMTSQKQPIAGVSAFDLSKDQEIGLLADASAGNAAAAFTLYQYYDFVVLDRRKAFQWLTRAAELEHPQAQYVLSKLLSQEEDVSKRKESRKWLERAAKNGYPEALSALEKLKNQ